MIYIVGPREGSCDPTDAYYLRQDECDELQHDNDICAVGVGPTHEAQTVLLADGAGLDLNPVVVALHDALGEQKRHGTEGQDGQNVCHATAGPGEVK